MRIHDFYEQFGQAKRIHGTEVGRRAEAVRLGENMSGVVFVDENDDITGMKLMTATGKSQLGYVAYVVMCMMMLDKVFKMKLEERNAALEAVGISDVGNLGKNVYDDGRIKVGTSLMDGIFTLDVMCA